MKKISKRLEVFLYKHRNWGIPNLMLYIALGSAFVSIITIATNSTMLLELLCFDKASILQGQVWRLFTYVFTDNAGSLISLIFLYFFYMLGRHVEMTMGTLRFNLFYFTGVLLMDAFAMIFSPSDPALSLMYAYSVYIQMGFYLHLSLILAFAATNPDARFLLFFIIPIRAWILSIIYLVSILMEIFSLYHMGAAFPNYLFPLVGIANFLLFVGKDVLNLLPPSCRPKGSYYRTVRQPKPQKRTGTIPFPQQNSVPKQTPSYTHRCTVCGRTDVSNPELEFRYCSRCDGYHCYCEDHISNHTHIE